MVPSALDRRELLAALAAGAAGGLAGCGGSGESTGAADDPTQATAEPVDDDEARRLAEAYAPTLYFDSRETWFPTDPRPYTSDGEDGTVVRGFDAVEGYLQRYDDAGGEPPEPTVFYRTVRYGDGPLAVVQFWLYSAFDQFTTNFHWHDWELLQAFVDTATGEAQLYAASAHSRKVPNNEHLDPGTEPRVLSELGSHSSGMSVNDRPDSFQRFPLGETGADITNEALGAIEALADFPLAYGLPRDENSRLPYVVPELDGTPVYDHPELPTFRREHLVPPELTIRSLTALQSPPRDIPTRETGVEMGHGSGDVAYDLVPAAEAEGIDAFVGPQLSFEFAVPKFVEDAVASHITTAGTPWDQPRYRNPLTDVTDPAHRNELAARYDAVEAPGTAATVVGVLAELTADEDAPDEEGVESTSLGVEGVALLESDPEAVPTFGGVAALRDVPEGEHRLTVNVAGTAPYSERLGVGDDAATPTATPAGTESLTGTATASAAPGEGTDTTDTTGTGTAATPPGTAVAGARGQVSMVARENAVKLRVDGEAAETPLAAVAVTDDFGGPVYENATDGRDAVYLHRGGAYTTDVRDEAGVPGAFRVNPGRDDGEVTIEDPETGKASLAAYLVDLFADTRRTVEDAVEDRGKAQGLLRALAAVEEAATRAVEDAREGNPRAADQRLDAVLTRVGKVRAALTNAAIPKSAERAVRRRSELGEQRATLATETEL